MINFREITLQNFLSFGQQPTTIRLDSGNTILIQGSNGTGKTTLFQAIAYALFDRGMDKSIKKNDLINYINQKNMIVTLSFDVDGVEYTIKRGRKPNVLELTRNGEPYTRDSTKNTDEDIREIIGFDFDLFSNSIALSANGDNFMALTPANQRAFIESLIELDVLTERANTLKTKQSENNVEIRLEKQSLEQQESENNRIKSQIDSLASKSKKWHEDRNAKIKSLTERIQELSKVDYDAELAKARESKANEDKIKEYDANIKRLQSDLAKINQRLKDNKNRYSELQERQEILSAIDYDAEIEQAREIERLKERKKDIQNELSQIRSDIKSAENQILRDEEAIKKLHDEQAHLLSGECPYCHQRYASDEKIEEIKESIDQYGQNMDKIEKDCAPLLDKEDSLTEELSNISIPVEQPLSESECYQYKAELSTIEDKLKSLDSEIQDDEIQVKPLENDLNNLEGEKAEIELEYDPNTLSVEECINAKSELENDQSKLNELKSDNENPYDSQIETLKASYKDVSDDRLKYLEKLETHYKFLIKLLTDNKSFVRKALVGEYIPFINKSLNEHLKAVQSEHRAFINNDLTVDIEYLDGPTSYGNLSNGERLRLNLATSLAFRDLMDSTDRSCNIQMNDEYSDAGLDSLSIHNAFNMLKDTNLTTFIITHREELNTLADEVWTINKKFGFSEIAIE